ncbi:hypothetical protein DSL72_000390 [Monilinia vaccinii-corymbosi]|uniref:SnoaL-like domain-containing protein n=1 Tax=Monilinia vaccinii-corymbosi TaxID=61207 RepID=A0A8A3P1H4_9HELO|nr:hypothetical protein DSL72_000390 [Monilinia vaccinii-corymbosi]
MGLLSMAQSLNFGKYSPAAGVDAGFQAYLKQLYTSAEDPAATSAFTNFFVPSGKLIVLDNVATGATQILALKQKLLPKAGNKHWNHRPNTVTVDSETSTQKVFKVLGSIETTYDGGKCSKATYETRFTIQKNAAGKLVFNAHSGNLVKYDDYSVVPPTSPTNIACDP